MLLLPSMLNFAAKKRLQVPDLRLFRDFPNKSRTSLKYYDSKLLRLSSSSLFHTSSADRSSGDGKEPPPDVPTSTLVKSGHEDKGLDVKVTEIMKCNS